MTWPTLQSKLAFFPWLETLTNPNVMLMHAVGMRDLQARALRPWIIVAGHRPIKISGESAMSSVTSEKRCVFSWHTLLAYGQALETQTSHHSPINVFYNLQDFFCFFFIFFHKKPRCFSPRRCWTVPPRRSTKKRSGRSTAPCCAQLAVRTRNVYARCWSHSS